MTLALLSFDKYVDLIEITNEEFAKLPEALFLRGVPIYFTVLPSGQIALYPAFEKER